jgi:Gpi18-like mannosyltransferase
MSIVLEIREQVQTPLKGWSELRVARWIWKPLMLFAVTRLAIAFIAYLAVPLIADSQVPIYHLRPEASVVLDVFGSRWDTGFYVSIAEEGYRYEGVELPSVPFFPLLPLLMRTLTPLVGDTLLAGVLISNVTLLLTVVLFYRLVAAGWGQQMADRTIWYFLIFPAAFFGSAIYTESLFLLCAIGALYFARRGYWEVAALLGIAATMTRFVGIIVAVMLLVEWWVQRRTATNNKRPSVFALLAPAAVPLGTLAYMAYLQRAFGDPLAFVHGAAAWARRPQSPFTTLAGLIEKPVGGWGSGLLSGNIHLDNWLDFAFVAVFLALGFMLLYQKHWSEGVFVTLGILITMSSGLLMSQRRYMWVLFPAFIVLAQWGDRPWADKLITTISLVCLALFTAMFANGYWVG